MRSLVHLHGEEKSASFAWTVRMYIYFARAHFNDAFDDCQAKTNAFMIYFSGSLDFTKAREELWHFILRNTRACVCNVHNE